MSLKICVTRTPFSTYPDPELLLFTDELQLTAVPTVDSSDTKLKPLPGNNQKQRLSHATTPPVRNIQFKINALFPGKLLTHCGKKKYVLYAVPCFDSGTLLYIFHEYDELTCGSILFC